MDLYTTAIKHGPPFAMWRDFTALYEFLWELVKDMID